MEFKTLVRKIQTVILTAFVLVNLLEKVVAEECTYNVNAKEGVIASPNFPKKYPSRKDCSWKFITTPGHKIKLVFDNFDIEYEANCAYDYVAVYDGHTPNDPVLGKFCGNKIPPYILSTTEKMLMVFHSDENGESIGFRATYKTGCFHRILWKEGTVSSPYYPNPYPTDETCIWEFETNPGSTIKLVFHAFELEEHAKCDYDYVALFDGHSVNDTLLGKFCGNQIPNPVTSITHRMLLIFHSDQYKVFSGFRASYSTGNLMHYMLSREGFVNSPNYPQNYGNDETRFYKIETTAGHQIKLVFDFFELEAHDKCYYDYIAVYDGHTVDDTLLGTFCGNKMPSSIITSSNKMLIMFHSDVSIVFRGFRAKYTTDFAESSIKHIPGVIEAERNLTQYLLGSRRRRSRSLNKWGTHLTRTAVALFLRDRRFFAPDNKIGEEIAYELSFQLMKMISLNTITTMDLALYINALTVACISLKDTFKYDIVKELRKRANYENRTVSPYSLLTLCNAKDTMTTFDVLRIPKRDYSVWQPLPADTQAVGAMALSCMYYRSNASLDVKSLAKKTLDEIIPDLKRKQLANGSFGNLKTTSIVVQALLSSENDQSSYNLNAAINFILQEVRRTSVKIEDVYYILPLLNSMSLVNINSDHCIIPVEMDSQGHSNKYIETQISVIIGDNKEFSQTWKFKIPLNSTYYEALEKFSSLEPDYKAHYTLDTVKKPYLTGLGNYQNNPEDGLIWFIHTRSLISKDDWQYHLTSLADTQVKENEELILWYRSQLKTDILPFHVYNDGWIN